MFCITRRRHPKPVSDQKLAQQRANAFIIVDDQRPFLLMLKGIISKLGVRSLRIVQSAENAISDCRKEKFDVVIADLHLGNNKKNGYQLIEQLRIQKLAKADTVYMMVSGDSHRPVVLGSI